MSFISKLRKRLGKSAAALSGKIEAVIEADGEAEDGETPSSPTPTDNSADNSAHNLADNTGAKASSAGFLARLTGRQKSGAQRRLDDAMLEALEDALIAADLGVETALEISANLAQTHYNRSLDTAKIKAILAQEIEKILTPVAKPLPLYQVRPQVILVVGVNGAGKTTTIGKLAAQFKEAGKSVLIAAGDTFRAAAVAQLEIWAERAQCALFKAEKEGADPAGLVYDALAKAQAEAHDLVIIDTAGRLQNRQDLMDELAKIIRVIEKKIPDAPHNTVLVLDATTGQNALSQVKIFQEIANISGLIMTKLDGTAKGGVLIALAARFGLPIHAIGLGEQIDDLAPFEARDFAAAISGNFSS